MSKCQLYGFITPARKFRTSVRFSRLVVHFKNPPGYLPAQLTQRAAEISRIPRWPVSLCKNSINR